MAAVVQRRQNLMQQHRKIKIRKTTTLEIHKIGELNRSERMNNFVFRHSQEQAADPRIVHTQYGETSNSEDPAEDERQGFGNQFKKEEKTNKKTGIWQRLPIS